MLSLLLLHGMHVFQRSNFFPPSRWDFSRQLLKKFALPLLVSTVLTWCCAHAAVFYPAAVATWGFVEAKQIINLFVRQVSELQKSLGSWFNRLGYFKRDGRRRLVLNARKDLYDLNGNYKVSHQTHCTKSWRKWWNCDFVSLCVFWLDCAIALFCVRNLPLIQLEWNAS